MAQVIHSVTLVPSLVSCGTGRAAQCFAPKPTGYSATAREMISFQRRQVDHQRLQAQWPAGLNLARPTEA